eukprot:TRINITY_DN734_c1_g1_i3.p1 TRINITY_DN734_c1_g1~~TRINITY_DN734_c1_g1_i3.p1  ORF type:complete len:101 (+),score=11.53 TRINITY_DN734_c1_g1_i3:65-367(+)
MAMYIEFNVSRFEGDRIGLRVSQGISVLELKEEIASLTNLPTWAQKLEIGGYALDDYDQLYDTPITNGCVVSISLTENNSRRQMVDMKLEMPEYHTLKVH